MSLSVVRTYLQNRVAAVDPDLKEWTDAFNLDNIPSSKIDKRYFIEFGELGSATKNDMTVRDTWPVTVYLFANAYNKPKEKLDEMLDKAHDLRIEAVKGVNAYAGQNIKNVELRRIRPQAIGESNDNLILIELEFDVALVFSAR